METVPAQAPDAALARRAAARASRDANAYARPSRLFRLGFRGGDGDVSGVYRLYWNSNCIWLACTEGDDPPDRIVRRNADRDPVSRDHFDSKPPHPAAQLSQHLVTSVTLHAVKPPAMHGHDSALHVDQIVLAQLLANPFF
jgi:hypothetical protein